MEIYPILNKPGKGKYVFIFILNERAVDNYELALAITDAGTPVKKLAIGIKK